jgi:hypothetical protein
MIRAAIQGYLASVMRAWDWIPDWTREIPPELPAMVVLGED